MYSHTHLRWRKGRNTLTAVVDPQPSAHRIKRTVATGREKMVRWEGELEEGVPQVV